MKGKTDREDRWSTPPQTQGDVKAPKGETMEEAAKRLGFKYKKND